MCADKNAGPTIISIFQVGAAGRHDGPGRVSGQFCPAREAWVFGWWRDADGEGPGWPRQGEHSTDMEHLKERGTLRILRTQKHCILVKV